LLAALGFAQGSGAGYGNGSWELGVIEGLSDSGCRVQGERCKVEAQLLNVGSCRIYLMQKCVAVSCFSFDVKLVTTPTFFWRKSPPLLLEGNKRAFSEGFLRVRDSWCGVRSWKLGVVE